MKRRASQALLSGVLAGAVAIPAGAPAAPAPVPERLLVTADEWSLTLSRTKLDPGPAIIELYNRGEDAHDVRIKRRGRKRIVAIPETASESTARVETTLRRDSRYVLWCSLAGHGADGMEAELRTTKR